MSRRSSHVIVRTHRPARIRFIRISVVVLVFLGGWWLFDFGRDRAGYDSELAEQRQALLLADIEDLKQQAAQLRARNAILVQASEIDHQAYAQVDSSLKALESEIVELKQQVSFYRGIVSPAQATGLRVQSFALVRNGLSMSYRYNLTLSQFVKNQRFVAGMVRMRIIGLQGMEQKELEMRDVSRPQKSGLRFRFKYFQELHGDIALPEGFEPLRVELRVVPEGKRKAFRKTFAWSGLVS